MPAKKLKLLFYGWCQWLARVLGRILFGCRYYGRENIPASGPLILASNHCSYFDPPVVGAAVPRPIHFMAKKELFKNPVFGGIIRFYHAVPVKRAGMDWKAVEVLKGILSGGGALIMFPQGTRRREGAPMGKPKFGVGMLAQDTGASIVPVFAIGTGRLKDAFLRRRPMRVYYGEPITPDQYAELDHGPRGQLLIAEMVMARIEAMSNNYATD